MSADVIQGTGYAGSSFLDMYHLHEQVNRRKTDRRAVPTNISEELEKFVVMLVFQTDGLGSKSGCGAPPAVIAAVLDILDKAGIHTANDIAATDEQISERCKSAIRLSRVQLPEELAGDSGVFIVEPFVSTIELLMSGTTGSSGGQARDTQEAKLMAEFVATTLSDVNEEIEAGRLKYKQATEKRAAKKAEAAAAAGSKRPAEEEPSAPDPAPDRFISNKFNFGKLFKP
jgi:hypothetical protein